MTITTHRIKRNSLLIGVVIISFLWSLFIHFFGSSGREEILEDFQFALQKADQSLAEELESMRTLLQESSFLELYQKNKLDLNEFNQSSIQFLMEKDDQLGFWTSNKIPNKEFLQLEEGLHKTSNGWYLLKRLTTEKGNLIAVQLVKQIYNNENTYLQSHFSKPFQLSKYSKIEVSAKEEADFFYGKSGFQLIVHPRDMESHGESMWWLDVVFLIAACILIFQVLNQVEHPRGYVLSFLGLLVLRWSFYNEHILPLLKTTFLFDPTYYAANDWTTSIADLILHALFVLFLFRLAFRYVQANRENIWTYSVYTFLLFSTYFIFCNVLTSIVEDGSIPMDLGDILSLDGSTLVALLGIFSFSYLLLFLIYKVVIGNAFISKSFLISMIINIVATMILFFALGLHDLLSYLSFIAIIILFVYVVQIKKGKWTGPFLILITAVFAFLINNTIQEGVVRKQESVHLQLLEKEVNERDPMAEFLIVDMLRQMAKDDSISLNWSQEDISKFISLQYISKLPTEFEFNLKRCAVGGWGRPTCLPELSTSSLINKGNGYRLFYDMIRGRNSYVAEVNIEGVPIYLTLRAFENKLSYGFPVLLVDKEFEQAYVSLQKSFAKYQGGILSEHRGEFPYRYHMDMDWRKSANDKISYIEEQGYKHALVRKHESTYVISQRLRSLRVKLAGYSYFFTFGIITLLIAYGVVRLASGQQLIDQALKTRFQTAMLFMLLFSTIVIGAGSIYYQKSQFNKKSFEAIGEKIKSVETDLSSSVFSEVMLEQIPSEKLNDYLRSLTNTFFTDINLYGLTGTLYASSQKRIFESGILSKQMHPEAFKEMFVNQKSQFVHVEQIGELSYLSAYVPIINNNNQLIAFVNLPYFAKTSEFDREISNLLLALVNIYALLIILSLFLGYVVSNRITKPLEIIQENMASLRIGNSQKAIDWEGDDEIGRLVKQYNMMVRKLEESALQLAAKEREDAWREMAQQVAHEIKNPLTPMKLSIQHFQSVWDRMTEEERKQKFTSMSAGLIEQIETLNAIASEFSTFAKLPQSKKSEVKIVKILRHVFELYDKYEHIEFAIKSEDDEVVVMADKDQMLRVFTNILQNAVQAIPEDAEGSVFIEVSIQEENVVIQIQDNGSGVPEDIQDKIFTPNFTTKSTGTGLGLAMAKQIVENHNGSISFKTAKDIGTTFVLRIPKN